MSIYGEAITALKAMVLVDERVQLVTGKVDRLADEVRHMSDRLTRLETIISIARPDGAVLRIAPAHRAEPSAT